MDRTRAARGRPTAEPAVRPRPEPIPTPAAALLAALQRGAGNRAVGEMLARSGGGAVMATTPAEKRFRDAVAGGSWDVAAHAIAEIDPPTYELVKLSVDELRLLQDGVVRRADRLGPAGQSVLVSIGVTLQAKGVDPARTAPGAAFGQLTFVESPLEHGDPAKGTSYSYGISFQFLPDPAAVGADRIAFIQTARIVDSGTGENRDTDASAVDRQTGNSTSIDVKAGRASGWYSMKPDATADTSLRIWERSAPRTSAWMLDRPRGTVPNATWEFETAVVSLGPDAGTVYATVLWGFSSDAALKITPRAPRIANKASREFGRAVEAWNEQAADPARQNAPGQQPLPALR